MGKQLWKPGNMLYPLPVVMVSLADRDGPVAVGVGLDDRHHRHFGLAADRVKIGRNSVQVNDRPGAVVGHNPSGSFRA